MPGSTARTSRSELDGVTKRFGETTALDELSLLVRRGELMTLLGPSGCGKTTLLNLVAGFLVPDRGEIAIDGQRVTDLPSYRREIGIMFQNYALFPHMNVAANVGYGLRMRRIAKPEIERRVAEALALVKLEGLEDRKPRQLSGGQQQRVALARALVIRPKVLLLDEPFSALDKSLRASMQVEIKEIQRKLGVTTIFVTHDQSEALSLSDRIAVIAQAASANSALRTRSIAARSTVSWRHSSATSTCCTPASGASMEQLPRSRLARRRVLVPIGDAARRRSRRRRSTCSCGRRNCVWPSTAWRSRHTAWWRRRIYQGGHVDLYVDMPEVASGRVLLRVPGIKAMSLWPAGARIGIALAADQVSRVQTCAGVSTSQPIGTQVVER